MFADIIRLLIALSCALFVLSLPVAKTTLGQTLRRAAGFCCLLALLPALLSGLFFAGPTGAAGETATGSTGAEPVHHFLANIGAIAVLIVLAICAYGVLRLRARFRSKSRPNDPWESFFKRGGGKKRVRPNGASPKSVFSFGDDEDDG